MYCRHLYTPSDGEAEDLSLVDWHDLYFEEAIHKLIFESSYIKNPNRIENTNKQKKQSVEKENSNNEDDILEGKENTNKGKWKNQPLGFYIFNEIEGKLVKSLGHYYEKVFYKNIFSKIDLEDGLSSTSSTSSKPKKKRNLDDESGRFKYQILPNILYACTLYELGKNGNSAVKASDIYEKVLDSNYYPQNFLCCLMFGEYDVFDLSWPYLQQNFSFLTKRIQPINASRKQLACIRKQDEKTKSDKFQKGRGGLTLEEETAAKLKQGDDVMNKLFGFMDKLVSNPTSDGNPNSINFGGSYTYGNPNINYNYGVNNISNHRELPEVKVKDNAFPPKDDFHIAKYLTECVEDKNLTEDERNVIDRTCLLDTDNNNKLKRIIAHSWHKQGRFDKDSFAQLLALVSWEA